MPPIHYEFEWDPAKAIANWRKHSVSFEQAAAIFRDPGQVSVHDEEPSDEEDRWVTLGRDGQGRLLAVIHSYRHESEDSSRIRIISARKATRRETLQYEEDGTIGEMKTEYDFSKGERGKFYNQDASLHIPIYLDPDVEQAMQALAKQTGQSTGELVNDWLRSNIGLIQTVQPAPDSG